MSKGELIDFCTKVANGEVSYIPATLRPLIAAEYEVLSGFRLECRCPDAIKDAAIWLSVEFSESNGAEGGDTSGGD